MAERFLLLSCPACGAPKALACVAYVTAALLTVSLEAQSCACDPFHQWDEVWEQARERVVEEGEGE